MKIVVSVVGRFHAFDLAYQFQKHFVLKKLITTYPKYITKKWGIPSDLIHSNLFLEFIRRYLFGRLSGNLKVKINSYIQNKHAISILKYIDQVDVFIGWSGSSLKAIQEAKSKNIITILERGSSHYSYQMEILKQEYLKYNLKFTPDHKQWERELQEYELADYISVPSKFVYSTFLQYGISEKKLLVNNYGVNLNQFKKIPKEDSVFRVIYAGGFTIRKGVEYLLKAFTELNLPNSELVHLGSLPDETLQIRKKYNSSNIKYLGHKNQSDLYKYYSQGSVFVHASIEEGLSMVLPQAMACGLPIICSENTGGADLISDQGKEGFVFKVRDVEALKAYILFCYENPDALKKMSKYALERVQTGFSWDDYGNRYMENINKLMASEQ